jgi:hypothetical protein
MLTPIKNNKRKLSADSDDSYLTTEDTPKNAGGVSDICFPSALL